MSRQSSIGYQCDSELILRLLSLSTASSQHIYKSSVSQWTASIFVYGYDLH